MSPAVPGTGPTTLGGGDPQNHPAAAWHAGAALPCDLGHNSRVTRKRGSPATLVTGPPLWGRATPKTTRPRPILLELPFPLPTATTPTSPEVEGAMPLQTLVLLLGSPPCPDPMAAMYSEAETETTVGS